MALPGTYEKQKRKRPKGTNLIHPYIVIFFFTEIRMQKK
jgi:hypothetical protein